MSVNKAIIVGRLGNEPESRAFPNGGSVCNISVATSESWKDKQTGERQERTEWHRVVLKNKLGEIAQQYLHKGSQVYIEGRIQTRKWQNQQGQDQYSTEIIATNMTMLDSKSSGNQESNPSNNNVSGQNSPQNEQNNQESAGGYYDDDIPFVQHMRGSII